ncbi:MAG: class I SAM-dependent methyltransferase [Bacteroidota bacterium]
MMQLPTAQSDNTESIILRLQACPSCGSSKVEIFNEVRNVPVHSVLLMDTREEAITFRRGDIALGFCASCGFISNLAFDPAMHEYSQKYEETQGFSETFSTFHRNLATRLIERYNLRNKDIIEIGCGKGEFLSMLCEIGNNRGVGFDPAYIPERNTSAAKDKVKFIVDFYSEKYTNYQADFVCCKMTLEHIQNTEEFVKMVRRSIGDRHDTIVFFQIPDVTRVLRDIGFWDVYYEHCSYFSPGSLGRLFRKAGFDVVQLATEYDDQYLMIEARPAKGIPTPPIAAENDMESLRKDVEFYASNIQPTLNRWRNVLSDIKQKGQKAVIWGGGSKGVAFLTTLGITDEIEYAVDINPFKHGTFMAGTGQEIVSPEFLREYKPEIVVVMNPIYCPEIQKELNRLGITAKLLPV